MEPKQIGRYEIQRRLGKGGMGSLYLARDPGLDRLVAIKLLKDDYQDDKEFRERFAREARALARLRHPNIVVVYDFGDHEGRPFMAMEYIDGETLTQRLRRVPPLHLAQGLELVENLCAGLASAHDAGIVHRDIKPDNIMLDRQGTLKLLDFGIARHTHMETTHQMTQPGMIMGTYNYMSPEQLVGGPVDKRSDVFAVGAVLYQVVALEQAFPGEFGAVYHGVLTTGPKPLEERVPGIDPDLARVVRRALDRDPSRRYQDANEMRRGLSQVRYRLEDRGGAAETGRETIAPPPPRTSSSSHLKHSEAKRGLVSEQLRLGREALEKGEHETALQYGERAEIVDPDNRDAHELINRARLALSTKLVLAILDDVRDLLSKRALHDASARVEDASAAVADLPEAEALRQQIAHVARQVREAVEREEQIGSSLERARQSFDRGQYETALRAVYEALALDPNRVEAREAEQRAKAQLEVQRERERVRREALERLSAARALADEGRFDEAAAAVKQVVPSSDSVRRAASEALAEIDRLYRQSTIAAAVTEARTALMEGRFETAISRIETIPEDERPEDAHQIRAQALDALEQRRELAQRKQRLDQSVTWAEAAIESGQLGEAESHVREAAELGLDDDRIDALHRRVDELRAAEEARRQQELLTQRASVTQIRERTEGNSDAYAPTVMVRALEDAPIVDVPAEATIVRPPRPSTANPAPVPVPISAPVRTTILAPAPAQKPWRLIATTAGVAIVSVAAVAWLAFRPAGVEKVSKENAGSSVQPQRNIGSERVEVTPPRNDPDTSVTGPVTRKPDQGGVGSSRDLQSSESKLAEEAKANIQRALNEGDLASSERLLRDADRKFGALNFTTQAQALEKLRAERQHQQMQTTARELLEKSRQERDHQAAIGLLQKAAQLIPGDQSIQAELRRRNDAAAEELRQKDADERLRQARERDDAIKNAQGAIERALGRGDLDGADAQIQDAERRYGTAAFATQRQLLSRGREQGLVNEREKVRSQIRAVLDRFAQAYSAKDVAGVAAVWPSVPRSLTGNFRDFQSLSWVFGACEIDVAGVSGTARCAVTLKRVDIRGRVTSDAAQRRFTLRNEGQAWRIDAMQVQ